MVCLISDLLVDVDGLMRGLQHFRHHDHEVLLLHVMDADELTFPFQGNTQFRGLEDTGKLTIEPRVLRQGYLEAVQRFTSDVKRRCIAHQIDYRLISTADHLDAAILAFLSARTAALRKASARR
jgi:glycine/D-amino acid oxidase-like deaminating enzyme